jgi:hypothetical protein
MAEKQAVFTLKVDTGNSVQDVQNFDHAVQSLNKDLKETQATASQQTGLDGFESKLQELDQKLKAGGLSMREMNKLMKEYQTVALQAGSASPIGDRATQSAAALKDQIVDLDTRVRLLSSDTIKLDTAMAGIATGAAAFQGVTSAVALTGVESEALVQTMVKLQAAQGLVNSVNIIAQNLNKDAILGIQIRSALQKAQNFILYGSAAAVTAESTATKAAAGAKVAMTAATTGTNIALKLFRGALIATGIGALIVGVGLLIANFDKVKAAVMGAVDRFKGLSGTMKTVLSIMFPFIGVIRLVNSALESMGIIDSDQDKAREENSKKEAIRREQELKQLERMKAARELAFNSEQKALDRLIAIRSAEGKSVDALTKQKIQGSIDYQKELQKETEAVIAGLELFLSTVDTRTAHGRQLAEGLQQNIDEITAKNEEAKNSILDSENELKIADINAKKEIKDRRKTDASDAKNTRKSIIDALQKSFNDELKLQDELEKNKLALMAVGRAKELAMATSAFQDYKEKFLIERTKDEKAALDKQFIDGKITRQKYNAELLDLQIMAANKLTDTERKILIDKEQKLLQDLVEINKKFDAQELLDLAEKEKKKADLRETFNALFRDQFDKQTADAKKANDEQLKNLDEAIKAGAITENEAFIAKIKLANNLADAEKKIEKDKNEFIKAEAKKAREEQLKGITDLLGNIQKGLDGIKQVNDLVNEIDQARLNSIENRREDELANLDANLQAQLNQEGLTAEQKTKIEEKFAKQKYDVQVKAFAQEEKIKKAQFLREKALKLAQVGIDTASAIVKGIAQFGPPPSPAGIAAIASAGIIGVTQALAIANQQYQSGTAPTAPQLGPGGSAGSLTGESASSFTANTNTQTTDLTTLGQGSQQGTSMSQVVVLESDITGTQNKVRLQEAKTSF